MKKAVVISAHAGTGKKVLSQKYENVLDLESSDYKWIYPPETKSLSKEERKAITNRKLKPLWQTIISMK